MILVTGATGLLGSHVVGQLISGGSDVRAMFRSEERKAVTEHIVHHYFPENAAELLTRVEWVSGDILDLTELEDAMRGCDQVVHCAALVSFDPKDFWRLFQHNRRGTANVVNTALDLGIEHLVYVSSTAAIGSDSVQNDGIRRETDHWNANEKASGYSLSKYSAEKEVWRAIEEGLPAAIVNPSVMFGPGSWNDSSLKIFRTLQEGLKYYTKGSNAFVDVRDVADAVCRLLDAKTTGERFLVAGHNMSFRSLFDMICAQMEVTPPQKLAGPGMTELAWRLDTLRSWLTGRRPTLTRESAESAQKTMRYSSEKWLKQFPDFQFRELEDTIAATIAGRLRKL